ncbi:MAG: hypothetical protein U1E26_09915 [Coriobacteriia bacterium]|nr:hypothetical protein [Coriobacteriia bacterium]
MIRFARIALAATLAAGALYALTGCTSRAQAEPAASILGTWYDDATGAQYRFISDSLVVVPWKTPGGGNALAYSLDGGRLDIVFGQEHRVSVVEELESERLVLADPITAERQLLLRAVGDTTFVSELATGAERVLREIGAISAAPDIEWASTMPEGDGTEWTAWSPSTLDAYASAWDWSRATWAPEFEVATSGGGETMGMSFTLLRVPPPGEATGDEATDTAEADAEAEAVEPEEYLEEPPGLPYIHVGYSAAKSDYAAGTLVYVDGKLLYHLGEGYAIPVEIDPDTQGFRPVTHE